MPKRKRKTEAIVFDARGNIIARGRGKYGKTGMKVDFDAPVTLQAGVRYKLRIRNI